MHSRIVAQILILLLCCSFVQAQNGLQFEVGEKIALVGNSLAERMNLYGYFETRLHLLHPEKHLKFRNFGFPADEVGLQQRPNNYTKIDDPLVVFGPETFICLFGFNESFGGTEPIQIDQFKANYLNYIDNLSRKFSSAGRPPRIILVSPVAFEPTGKSFHPDGKVENENLKKYSDAIAQVADVRNLRFVNLFDESKRLFDEERGNQFTINGCHLNENGDRAIARLLSRKLFGADEINEASQPFQSLREAVNDKSWVHANDYRMLNGWYVYGGRRTFDKETFPREYKKIRAMVAVRDQRVWDIAMGNPVSSEVDDSATGELFVPPTGVGRHFPRSEPKDLKYLSPEESIATMKVPEGMEVKLFASEMEFPELANPCQIAFDNKGRLWVSCMPNYPQWKPGDKRPDDRLLILEDTDSDGKADKCTTFYDKLICPTGFEFYNGGVLVIDEPRILFLKDTDGDDRADQVEQMIDGIATDDTHHTMGAWEWSHGGRLHMLEGIQMSTTLETPWGPFRNKGTAGCYVFDPRSLRWRRFITPGYGNPWCCVFDKWGMGIVGDGTNAQQHWASPLSGSDPGRRGTTRPVFDNEGMRPAVGSEFLISRHLPEEFQEQFIYACVINMNGLPRFTVADDDESSGFKGQRIDDLLSSTDKCFRPVDPKVGPDGAIWFGDWCNALIGHMQYSQRDPNRDKRHGRIYRLVNRNKPLLQPEEQHSSTIDELISQLTTHELRTRYRVRRELWSRPKDQVLPAIDRWINDLATEDPQYERNLCEALWVQEHFHSVDGGLVKKLMDAQDFRARAAAVHVVGNEHQYIEDALDLFSKAISDTSFRVRLEAIRGLSFLESVDAPKFVLKALDQPIDYWIGYTMKHAMMALRPVWQAAHLKGEFTTSLDKNEQKWFAGFLASMGPSTKAIPHIQIIADSSKSEAEHADAVSKLSRIRGNKNNGSRVFRRVCTSCHYVDGRGINFGPNIKDIKKRLAKDQIRESIIYSIFEPNRDIADEYKTTKILTVEGELFSGFVEKQTDKEIVMRLAGDKVVKVQVDDIEESSSESVSSMPEGLGLSVAPDELLDLVEYIAAMNGAGLPDPKKNKRKK